MPSEPEQNIDRILGELNEMVKAKHEETICALTKQIEADIDRAAKKLKAALAKTQQDDDKVANEI